MLKKAPDPKKNKPGGKLRLMYEGAVVGFIAREAGGIAIDERGVDILDIEPDDRHQRTALFVGNKEVVESIRPLLKRQLTN